MPQETLFRIHAPIPDLIIRDKAQTIELQVYDASGTLIAPTSGTLTLKNGGGTAIIDAQAVTVTADIATYALTAADLPTTEAYSSNWLEEWTLLIGTETHTFSRAAHLVRSELFPTVVQADLERSHQNLSRAIKTGNDADSFITEAWYQILRRLLKNGRFPEMILSPYSLHDALAYRSLELIFRDAHSAAGDGKYAELAEAYHEAYESEWATLVLDNYDYAQDGIISDDDSTAAEAVVYFGGPGVATEWLRWPR
jgi:hypothetical protein